MPPLRIRSLRPTTLAALIGLAAAMLFSILEISKVLDPVEHIAYDFRFRLLARPELASRDVVIIPLDNASFEFPTMLENFGRWPWRRKLYAQLLWYLRKAPARAIGIDITFAGRDADKESDDLFAEELANGPDTWLAFSLNRTPITWNEGDSRPGYPDLKRNAWTVQNEACGPREQYEGVEISRQEFNQRARSLGCITISPDADGVIRRTPLMFRFEGRYYPSFALSLAAPYLNGGPGIAAVPGRGTNTAATRADRDVRTARFECNGRLRIGNREMPVESADSSALVYWYGGYERSFKRYPVWEVFNSALAMFNEQKPPIEPSEFKDKIVLIGPTATSLGDFRATPFSNVFPGVAVHATVISNLLQGHFVRPAGQFWAIASIVLLALGASLAVWRFADWRAYTAMSAALAASYLAVNFWLFYSYRISLLLVAPVAALAASYGAGNLSRYVTEGREKRRYRATLMKYVAPQIVEAIMQDTRLAELHNEKRDLTVLFSDVRGFTSLSEKIPVGELVATLNEFLDGMVGVIFRHGGTLDKFVGDCVMAFWGAPVREEDHAELAARAALEMQATLARLNEEWRRQGRPQLKIGVGINTGEMIFGNIGSQQRMDFTVIGDNVNLASRLESSTKELNASIVISDATYQRIAALAQVRDLGTIHVKGKDTPIRVYELIGMAGKEPESYASAST